jgi:hypothetical protein
MLIETPTKSAKGIRPKLLGENRVCNMGANKTAKPKGSAMLARLASVAVAFATSMSAAVEQANA